MSKTTGDFIISLAEQSGATLDEAQTKSIQAIETELPEGIAEQIQGSLYTVESALANSEITNKIKSESLDAVDQKLQSMAMQLGQDSDFVQKLKDTKGTYKGMDLFASAVLATHKAALEKAKEGAPKGEQKELQDEITKLNGQLSELGETHVLKTDHDAIIATHNTQLSENAQALLQMKQVNLFAGKNWAMKDLSPEVNTLTANTLFNTELTAKGLKLVDVEGILKLQTKEDKPYFVENKEVTPLNLVDSMLAGHKLLTVSDSKTPITTTTTTTVEAVTDTPGLSAAMQKAADSNKAITERMQTQ